MYHLIRIPYTRFILQTFGVGNEQLGQSRKEREEQPKKIFVGICKVPLFCLLSCVYFCYIILGK